jgi:hypothetical protein
MTDKQRIDRLVIVVSILCFVVAFQFFMSVLS